MCLSAVSVRCGTIPGWPDHFYPSAVSRSETLAASSLPHPTRFSRRRHPHNGPSPPSSYPHGQAHRSPRGAAPSPSSWTRWRVGRRVGHGGAVILSPAVVRAWCRRSPRSRQHAGVDFLGQSTASTPMTLPCLHCPQVCLILLTSRSISIHHDFLQRLNELRHGLCSEQILAAEHGPHRVPPSSSRCLLLGAKQDEA